MTTALGFVVLTFTVVCTAALAWLHVTATRFSPVHDPVSAYGASEFRRGYAAAAISIGVAGAAAAFAVAWALPEISNRVVALLLVFAAARIAIPWFPLSTRLRVHWLLAFAAFASFCWAATAFGAQAAWDVAGVLKALGWVATGGAVLTSLTVRIPALRSLLGLVERVFYAAMLLWFLVVGLHLTRFG